jgi:hypothetical protein
MKRYQPDPKKHRQLDREWDGWSRALVQQFGRAAVTEAIRNELAGLRAGAFSATREPAVGCSSLSFCAAMARQVEDALRE